MKKKKKVGKKKYFGLILIVVLLLGAAGAIILNRGWIYDYFRGVTYQPSGEMITIRDDLDLTDEGKFLFNASQPVLNSREAFNENCGDNGDSEVAILGCYRNGNIYVYDIKDSNLEGIRELTTAHELLHVVWARMSESERKELGLVLEQVLDANQSLLGDEIGTYDASERQEELYVRVGTEITDLPEVLERHFAKIFKDQDRIVKFYNSYIAVFRELKTEMEALKNEIEIMGKEIEIKTTNYEDRMAQLSADITSFNSCARVAGCFNDEASFYGRRQQLVVEQTNLEELYYKINDLIVQYNTKIDKYNEDVLQSKELQKVINSSLVPDEINF